MKILVTFALENEFAPWKAQHDFRATKWAGRDAQVARIAGVEVGVVLTGAGREHARDAASAIFGGAESADSICISAGLAGALKPEYKIGEALAARRVISDGSRKDGRTVSEPGSTKCSAELIAAAGRNGATIVEAFYTSSAVVATADAKKSLSERADAVEMESFDILREAGARGLQRIAIRAVSDGCDEDLPLDMNQVFAPDGQVSVPRVLGQVARHPAAIAGLMRLGKNSKRAAESLGRFLDSYIEAIARSSNVSETKSGALVR